MRILNYEVSDALVKKYVSHLNSVNKNDMQGWDEKRRELHNGIFESVKIKRNSTKGKAFDKELNRFCELKINNINEIFAKRISNCQTKEEMEHELAKLEFIKKWSRK